MPRIRLLATALFLSLVANSLAQDGGDLEVALVIRKSFSAKKNIASVVLVNKGTKPITVFSKGVSQSMDFDRTAGKAEVIIGFGNMKVSHKGHELVASKYKFLPVTLRPGEAASYELLGKPFGNPFLKLRPGTKEVSVKYLISEDFGKRYGVWHGEVSSKTFRVVNQEIQAE